MGATSGVGFEATAQLAEAGYTRVTITGRSLERAEQARADLEARTGRDVFATLALELDSPESVWSAGVELVRRGDQIDFLLLNAGVLSGGELIRTEEGIEGTVAPMIGHHRLTMRLLEAGPLSEDTRIVTSGSEAARGDVPIMNSIEPPKLAAEHFANDPIAAVAIQRFDPPLQYSPTTAYSMAKVLVAYWTATLARRLPAEMTVNAVSPGNALTTSAPRNAGFMMRRIMLPLMKILPGMSDTVTVATKRYLDAAQFADDQSGDFYASPPKKMISWMEKVVVPHVLDEAGQEAAWETIDLVASANIEAVKPAGAL